MLRVLVNAATIALAAHFVPGIVVRSLGAALVAGLVLGIINAVVRPILAILTLPLTLLTFGLFPFVLNAFCLWLTSVFVPGFAVNGFMAAFVGALIVAAVSWVLNAVLSERARWQRI